MGSRLNERQAKRMAKRIIWTLRLELDPVKLSDGTMFTPFIELGDTKVSNLSLKQLEDQHYPAMIEITYGMSENVYGNAVDESTKLIGEQEGLITQRLAAEAKAKAEAEKAENKLKDSQNAETEKGEVKGNTPVAGDNGASTAVVGLGGSTSENVKSSSTTPGS